MFVASVLAATLVVGATSGAVGAKLVTSKDIKDGTITSKDIAKQGVAGPNLAKNSVNWDAQLDAATKKKIASLAGAKGAPGAKGANGAPGADGDGSLVDWDYFGITGYTNISPDEDMPPLTELRGLNDDRLGVSEPGVYLVTVRGMYTPQYLDSNFPALYVGSPLAPDGGVGLHALGGDCDLRAVLEESDFPSCSSTFTVFMAEAGDLPVFLFGLTPDESGECTREESAEPGGCATPGAVAEVSLIRIGGAIPDTSNVPPLEGGDDDPTLRGPATLTPHQRDLLDKLTGR